MEFEWDPAKAKANIAKHGVSFEDAQEVFEDLHAIELLDDALNEERWCLLGRAHAHILVVIYTERGNKVRIISARQASKREQKIYLEQDSTD